MGKDRDDCLTTEHTARRIRGPSPRTPERYRVRRSGPARASCCDRVHELRDDLDGCIAEDERPAAVGSNDDFCRGGRKIAIGENKVFVYRCVHQRTRFMPGVGRSNKIHQ